MYQVHSTKKPYLIFALTDETYSLVCSDDIPEGADPHTYYFLMSFFNQCYWVLGSVIGNILGAILPFDSTGIDFSMTALFVVILLEQIRTIDKRRLREHMGRVEGPVMHQVNAAIAVSFGLHPDTLV